jgi:hypothetical protein
MIDLMTMACDSIKNISNSLRTFSRPDRDYKQPFNLHEGIDSISILNSIAFMIINFLNYLHKFDLVEAER